MIPPDNIGRLRCAGGERAGHHRRLIERPVRRFALAVMVAAAFLFVGCAPQRGHEAVPDPDPDNWVVISFDSARAMSVLLHTELAADKALRQAGAGSIDGNEVGQGEYDLYFVGQDRDEMWRLLKPIFDKASVEWSRVELRDGLKDKHPTVLRG